MVGGAFGDKHMERKSECDEKLKIEQYLENIRPYLRDMIDHLKTSGNWKIHLTIKIKFMLSKDIDENPLMYSKHDNRKIMIAFDTDEILKELFDLLLCRYQVGLEKSMKGSELC